MTKKEQSTKWQSANRIQVICAATSEMIVDAQEALQTLKLSTIEIEPLSEGAIQVFGEYYVLEEKKLSSKFDQCMWWRTQKLNARQIEWVKTIECDLRLLEKIMTEIITLAKGENQL